jgi:hypothetical protein
MLCRTVGRTVGTRLFTRINGYDSLPERLLRPPPGWPDEFKGALAALPPEEQRIIDLLYGPAESSKITYLDIYELLRKELAGRDVPKVLLLGSHGPEQNEDGLLKEAVRRIVEGWPPPPFRIAGRDEGAKRGGVLASTRRQAWQRISKGVRERPAQVRRPCWTRPGRLPSAGDRQPADRGDGAAKRPRPADPRAALVPWTCSAFLPKRVIGTKTKASAGSDRASLSGCQRIDDRLPSPSLRRVPRALQARRTQDLRLFHRRIAAQRPRSDQGPDAEYMGNRHQRRPRAHHWHPCQAPAESHIGRDRWICRARSQRPDCEARPHASSRCPY